MTQWTLVGTGPKTNQDWAVLFTGIDVWQAAWADLAGFHLGPPPAGPPLATHLWAWQRHAWLRARIDGDTWTGTALFYGTPPEAPMWERNQERISHVQITKIALWPAQDGRIAQRVLVGPDPPPETMWQLTPIRACTAPFVGALPTLD